MANFRTQQLPMGPWGMPFKAAPPPDDAASELIHGVLSQGARLGWGPKRVRAHIAHTYGRRDITLDMIRTVHAEVN